MTTTGTYGKSSEPDGPNSLPPQGPRDPMHGGRHDEVHVVAPSWQPLLFAVAFTLTLAGTVLTPIMWIAGLALGIISIVNWMTELRRDYHPADIV